MSMPYQSLDPIDDASRARVNAFVPDQSVGALALEVDEVRPIPVEKVKRQLFSIGKTVKPDVVMAFSRQLSSFLEAGIPVLDALEIVGQQTGSAPMRVVITDIRDSIHRGTSFASA